MRHKNGERPIDLGYKTCPTCGLTKDAKYFYERCADPKNGRPEPTLHSKCIYCENRFKADKRIELALKVIDVYSNGKNCCEWCGCDDVRVLEVDHINNDGYTERLNGKLPSGTTKFYRKILKERRDDLRILCRNCNWLNYLQHSEKQWEQKRIEANEQARKT